MIIAAAMSATSAALPLLEELMRRHDVTRADVEEEALQRALTRCCGGGEADTDTEALLAPVVRMAATNRELRRIGLPPLLLQPCEDDDDDDDTAYHDAARASKGLLVGHAATLFPGGLPEAERLALAAMAMPLDMYMLLRGDYGEVMGLRLRRDAYTKAMRACRTRRAVALRDQPDEARAYLAEQLVRIARRMETYIAKPKETQGGRRAKPTTATTTTDTEEHDDSHHNWDDTNG